MNKSDANELSKLHSDLVKSMISSAFLVGLFTSMIISKFGELYQHFSNVSILNNPGLVVGYSFFLTISAIFLSFGLRYDYKRLKDGLNLLFDGFSK